MRKIIQINLYFITINFTLFYFSERIRMRENNLKKNKIEEQNYLESKKSSKVSKYLLIILF
jgi:hypothetical protein